MWLKRTKKAGLVKLHNFILILELKLGIGEQQNHLYKMLRTCKILFVCLIKN